MFNRYYFKSFRLILLIGFILLSIFFGIKFINNVNFGLLFLSKSKIVLILVVFLYLITHLLRLARFYLIFFEYKISFISLSQVYFLTSFVNFILPFKVGEVFRISEYSAMINSVGSGLSSVWLDRFFDALTLSIFLVICFVFFPYKMFLIPLLAFSFTVVSLSFFSVLPFSCSYLSHFFLTSSYSIKGLYALRVIGSIKHLYICVDKLVRGRWAMLFFLSIFIWGLELTIFYLLVDHFRWSETFEYLNRMPSYDSAVDGFSVYYTLGFFTLFGFALVLNISNWFKKMINLKPIKSVIKFNNYVITGLDEQGHFMLRRK